MKALIQRVTNAKVEVEGQTVGAIHKGLLVLLGVDKGDTQAIADKLCQKVIQYRLFEDEQGKTNLNLQQVQGALLVVSQFTLSASTKKGLRPSFDYAAPPQLAKELYEHFVNQARDSIEQPVETGKFGANMQVSLTNDGPMTFMLEVSE